MKDIRIAVRVTAKEKDKIQSKARKSGLSTTEYVKQRGSCKIDCVNSKGMIE